jgi:hypothetical protein
MGSLTFQVTKSAVTSSGDLREICSRVRGTHAETPRRERKLRTDRSSSRVGRSCGRVCGSTGKEL